MRRLLLAAVALTVAFTGAAQAAPVLSSNVDSTVFNNAIGSTAGWSYLGQSTSAFSGTGTAQLRWRSSSYANSFGYSRTDYTGRTTIFSTGAGVGSSTAVSGYDPSNYLFYFQADGSDVLFFSDDNRQFTDGHSTGGTPGASQGDMDIFYNAAQSMWAFFFDDAGGGLAPFGDDQDYDDMVVTFMMDQEPDEEPTGVPEPGSLALLGASLLAIPALRRRRKTSQIA